MPRGDGTGPMGAGAMTGRGAGLCTGQRAPGYGAAGFGRMGGAGMGSVWGRGVCGGRRLGWGGQMFAGPAQVWPEAEAEKAMLRNRAQALQAELARLNERLAKLDAAKAGE